jgi:phage shock protein A
MSVLERLRRLIASNINALIESWSDPGSQIDELISNMEAAARDARDQVKDALIEDKRAARHVQKLDESIAEWTARAERAVRAGDEGLAKEALARRHEIEVERAEAEAARQKGRTEVTELERGLRELDAKLSAVKARKETLKTVMRVRAQKDSDKSAFHRYDRLVNDVEVKEAENELDAELGDKRAATEEVRSKIDRLQSESDVDARLAALKDQMNQTKKKPE